MKELYVYITQRIHPGSIMVAIAFDLLWSLFEGGLTMSGFGIILVPLLIGSIFIASFGAVTLIQRFGARDEWSTALTKGLALGVLAAVPLSVIGTVSAAGLGAMRLMYGADDEVILLGKLTRSWREIELTLRKLAPPDVRSQGLDDVINYLSGQRLLSSALADQLHDLRKQRNINIHKLSTNELSTLVDQVQVMENTLRARFLNVS